MQNDLAAIVAFNVYLVLLCVFNHYRVVLRIETNSFVLQSRITFVLVQLHRPVEKINGNSILPYYQC